MARPPRRVRVGDGRLTGRVVRIADGRPLAGARVGIVNGPQTTANELGEWTLLNAPAGTRMLDVRGVGYYPESRPVDVVAGAAPVRSALFTLSAMLDTVKVSASRLRFDPDQSGFEDRRRSGARSLSDADRYRATRSDGHIRHLPLNAWREAGDRSGRIRRKESRISGPVRVLPNPRSISMDSASTASALATLTDGRVPDDYPA